MQSRVSKRQRSPWAPHNCGGSWASKSLAFGCWLLCSGRERVQKITKVKHNLCCILTWVDQHVSVQGALWTQYFATDRASVGLLGLGRVVRANVYSQLVVWRQIVLTYWALPSCPPILSCHRHYLWDKKKDWGSTDISDIRICRNCTSFIENACLSRLLIVCADFILTLIDLHKNLNNM